MFDLLVKGGLVVDPTQNLEAVLDLAVFDGRIATLEPNIPSEQAERVLNASGCLLTPGLVDLHAHLYHGGTSIGAAPDEACLKHGVTTAVDGGSSGADNFAGFKKWIAGLSRTRVYCFLHLSSLGLVAIHKAGELANPAYADPEGALKLLRTHPNLAVGLKLRATEAEVGGPCTPFLRTARRVADEAAVPIMVHIGNTVETLPEILAWLKAGDIVTHCMTGRRNGLLDQNGRIWPEVLEARARGVLFDAAHGRSHFTFEIAARILDQGFLPDSISTDLTAYSTGGPVHDLPTTMTKFDTLGLSISKLVELAASRPAAILGKDDQFGSLKPGMVADVAALEWEEGDFRLVDAAGEIRRARRRLKPRFTLRAGDLIWPDAP